MAMWGATLIIAVYIFYDTLVFKVTPLQKIIAALITCAIFYLSVISLLTANRDQRNYWLCFFILSFCLIGTFQPALSGYNPMWFYADVASWILLCSLIILSSGIKNDNQTLYILCTLFALLFLCSIAGYLIGGRHNGRSALAQSRTSRSTP